MCHFHWNLSLLELYIRPSHESFSKALGWSSGAQTSGALASGLFPPSTPYQARLSSPLLPPYLVPLPYPSSVGFLTSSDIPQMPCSAVSGFCSYIFFPCLYLFSQISASVSFSPFPHRCFLIYICSSVANERFASFWLGSCCFSRSLPLLTNEALGLSPNLHSMREIGVLVFRSYPLAGMNSTLLSCSC